MKKKLKLIKPIQLVVGAKSSASFYRGTPIGIAESENSGLQTVEWSIDDKEWIESKISIADVMNAEYISESLLDELDVYPRNPYKSKFMKYNFSDLKKVVKSFITKKAYHATLIGNELMSGLNKHLREQEKEEVKTLTKTHTKKNVTKVDFFERNEKVLFFVILFIIFLAVKSLIQQGIQ